MTKSKEWKVEDLLSFVEYDFKALKKRLKDIAEEAIRASFITLKERKTILAGINEGL